MSLERKTPLTRKTPMKRGSVAMKRTAMVRHPSKSKNEFSDEARRDVRARSGGRCEVTVEHDCRGAATHMHHIGRRWHGEGTAENAVDCCITGHAWIHANVAEAEQHGWLRRSGPVR